MLLCRGQVSLFDNLFIVLIGQTYPNELPKSEIWASPLEDINLKLSTSTASIPMKSIGPIKILGPLLEAEVSVPLATFETPLWPSTNRGATVSRLSGGIRVTLLDDCMTRSVLVEAEDAGYLQQVLKAMNGRQSELEAVVRTTSQFAAFKDWSHQIVGKLLFLRFSFTTGDAAGHNMATKAAEALLNWVLKQFPKLNYVSISGNYCSDKKATAVNGILGRGKYMVAELQIPKAICQKYLKTSPEKIVQLNIKKNLIGTLIAGGIRSANAHFANMLLAFYLATGQDAANIVEGSQGIVHTELTENNDLYFSVTIPNLILGTIGNGKNFDFVKENLQSMGCLEPRKPGENAIRLAAIAAATVLCGEISLLAAQTCPGELMRSHLRLERLELERLEKVKVLEPC
jgi:hydroxymethylglutaryl-CoA reductase (NADPH)